MSAFAPFTEVQMQMMAMSKARGYSWQMMATCFEMPLDVVERVAWTHGKVWNRHLTKAERLVARETVAEAVGLLRRDLAEAEPHVRPTIVNSLTRLLKQQQEYAPRKRPRLAPVAAPVAPAPIAPTPPTPPTPPPVATIEKPLLPELPKLEPTSAMKATAAALIGLFLLVCTLLIGSVTSARRASVRTEDVVGQHVGAVLATHTEGRMPPTTAHSVQTLPPWPREPSPACRDGT